MRLETIHGYHVCSECGWTAHWTKHGAFYCSECWVALDQPVSRSISAKTIGREMAAVHLSDEDWMVMCELYADKPDLFPDPESI